MSQVEISLDQLKSGPIVDMGDLRPMLALHPITQEIQTDTVVMCECSINQLMVEGMTFDIENIEEAKEVLKTWAQDKQHHMDVYMEVPVELIEVDPNTVEMNFDTITMLGLTYELAETVYNMADEVDWLGGVAVCPCEDEESEDNERIVQAVKEDDEAIEELEKEGYEDEALEELEGEEEDLSDVESDLYEVDEYLYEYHDDRDVNDEFEGVFVDEDDVDHVEHLEDMEEFGEELPYIRGGKFAQSESDVVTLEQVVRDWLDETKKAWDSKSAERKAWLKDLKAKFAAAQKKWEAKVRN